MFHAHTFEGKGRRKKKIKPKYSMTDRAVQQRLSKRKKKGKMQYTKQEKKDFVIAYDEALVKAEWCSNNGIHHERIRQWRNLN